MNKRLASLLLVALTLAVAGQNASAASAPVVVAAAPADRESALAAARARAQAELKAAEQAVAEARARAEVAAAEAAGAAPAGREQIERFVVSGPLTPPPQGVTELKFRDFVKMPVGPKGLEVTERLAALVGQRVRLVGYMARQSPETPGMLVLSPLPVDLGDEDESLSDDLPVTATFVHLDEAHRQVAVHHLPGLLQFTGVLEVGPFEEDDGHVSSFRLRMGNDDSATLAALSRATITGSAH